MEKILSDAVAGECCTCQSVLQTLYSVPSIFLSRLLIHQSESRPLTFSGDMFLRHPEDPVKIQIEIRIRQLIITSFTMVKSTKFRLPWHSTYNGIVCGIFCTETGCSTLNYIKCLKTRLKNHPVVRNKQFFKLSCPMGKGPVKSSWDKITKEDKQEVAPGKHEIWELLAKRTRWNSRSFRALCLFNSFKKWFLEI